MRCWCVRMLALRPSSGCGAKRLGAYVSRPLSPVGARGTDLRLHRPVAVKLMRRDLARDPHFQARFRKEARSVASLNHPSIVSVYDTGEVSLEDGHHPVDCPYLVMELVTGRSLREVLHAEGAVGTERAVAWTREVLEALEHAHQEGIVHRDVKHTLAMCSICTLVYLSVVPSFLMTWVADL